MALLLFSLTVRPVRAASLFVGTDADTVADDGQCSLPEAIIAANTDSPSSATAGECESGSGADEIYLVFATTPFTLGSQFPAVTSERDASYEIVVMDADGGNPTRLTNNSVSDYYPTFSPD